MSNPTAPVAYNTRAKITRTRYHAYRRPTAMRKLTLSGFNHLGQTETRQYNDLGQLTRITQGTAIDIEYRFSATANDGKITSQKNWRTGEDVTYQYDQLERLIAASTTAGPQSWGLSWSYDGFGNRLAQSVTQGSAPAHSVLVNSSTNRISSAGFSYDSNGNLTAMPQTGGGTLNLTYDLSNRVTNLAHNGWTEDYLYSPDNRRIWRSAGQTFCAANVDDDGVTSWSPGTGPSAQYILYSPGGQKLGVYCLRFSPGGQSQRWTASEENVYWGSRLVAKRIGVGAMGHFVTDRLHSKGDGSAFYPYGESKTGAAGDDREQFATYTRDQTSGLDYADQRWYSSRLGRFTSSDPYERSAKVERSGSWNRYAYVENMPVDAFDPNGLATCRIVSHIYGVGIIGSYAEVHCTSDGGTIERQEWRSMNSTDVTSIETEFLVTLGRQIDAEEWAITENAVRGALAAIGSGISDECWNDHLSRIFTLYASDVPGASRDSVTQAAKNAILSNGLTTSDSSMGVSISEMFRNSERQYAAALQGGNKIWWRPGRNEGSVANWIMGAVLHEVLHNVGFDDIQLQTGLLINIDGTNTDNISIALALNCFN